VSGDGAFEDEMEFLRRTPADDDLAAFAAAVRVTLLDEPDRTAFATLVPRLAETARASAAEGADRGGTTERRPAARRPRWAPALRVAIAIALVPLLTAGLAVAGVKLPAAADDAFESVGVELPNQAASDDGGDAAPGAEDGGSEAPGATATGRDNAAEKSGQGQSKSNPAREGGRANGTNGRGRALGKRGLAPGQLKPKKNGGSEGNGNAIGRTDSTPPGQAKAKAEKGSSRSAGGSAKGDGVATGGGKAKGSGKLKSGKLKSK
jgi:hypothetical protein